MLLSIFCWAPLLALERPSTKTPDPLLMREIRLLTLISSLLFVAQGIIAPVMSVYLESLGASFAEISLILTSAALAGLATNYAAGYFSDRIGRRKPLLVAGLFLAAVAYFLLARVPNATAAGGLRVLEGIGLGAYGTLSLAMMGDLLDRSSQRGRRIGFLRGLGSFFFAAGAFTGGWIVAQTSSAFVFQVAAACYLAASVVGLLLREEARHPSSAQAAAPAQPPQPSVGRTLPAAFLVGVFLWTMALGANSAMWPNAMSHLGYSQQTISQLWGLAALVEFPGMHWAGVLSDTVGRGPVLVAGGLGMAVIFTSYIFLARWLPALIGIQALRGLAYGSYTASAMTFAAEQGSRATRGSVSGLFTTATSGGQLVGILAAGFVVQWLDFNALFAACATATAASALFFLSLGRRRPTEEQPVAAVAPVERAP